MFCQRGIFEDVSFCRRPPLIIEGISFEKTAGQVFVNFRSKVPVKGNQLGHRKAFFGIFTAGARSSLNLSLPNFLCNSPHASTVSGHTDRKHAARRNRFAMQLVELRSHLFIAQTKRRAAAAIDAVKFVFFRAVNDGKKVAADTV